MSDFNYNILITGDCSNNGSGIISISASGGTPPYSFQWVNPDLGIDLRAENEASVRENLTSGTYVLRLNDSTLPINQEFVVNIPVSNGVCASILNTRNSLCNANNGSVTGTSNSDYSSTTFYLYSGGGTFVSSTVSNTSFGIFDSLQPGLYYMVVEDLGGCSGKTPNFIIEDANNFDYGLYVVPNSSCGGQPIGKIFITGLTGTAPYTYQWSNGSILDSISGLSAGNYSVSVTDANGCSLTKSATIVDVEPVGFGVFTATPPGCFTNDGVLTLTITGGTAPFYYSASTGYVLVSYSRNFTLNNLAPGNYSISVTDAGLCSFVVSTNLASPEGFSSISVVGNNSTCSSNNGSIVITVDGGTAPYTYTLISPSGGTTTVTNNSTSQTFTNLSSGTYTVFVSSQIDPLNPLSICTYSEEVTIIAESLFTITTSVTGTTCGNNNGIVQAIASSGGVLPYIYAIDGVNDLDGIFTNLSSGQHLVTVTDASGCIQSANVVVPSSQPIDFSLYSTSCQTGNNGTITAFIGGGTPPFNFYWSDNVPNNPQQIKVTGLTAGTYSLRVVDANSCTKEKSITISCNQNLTSFQTYVMGSEKIIIQTPTKQGLLQMLNEGFADLTSNNESCNLISAQYFVKVFVNPLGISTQSSIPFTSTTLNQAPADNQYFNTAESLLLTIPGVIGVTVDYLSNQITVQTAPNNPVLDGQEIIIDLIIVYDIMCVK